MDALLYNPLPTEIAIPIGPSAVVLGPDTYTAVPESVARLILKPTGYFYQIGIRQLHVPNPMSAPENRPIIQEARRAAASVAVKVEKERAALEGREVSEEA